MRKVFNLREGFKALHGQDPEFFMRRDTPLLSIGGRWSEYPKNDSLFEQERARHNNLLDHVQAIPQEELAGRGWLAWQHDAGVGMHAGPVVEMAHRVVAMEKDAAERSRPTDIPLYRGATQSPDVELPGRGFLAASENRSAAQWFARRARGHDKTARVDTLKPGVTRGFPLSDLPVTRTSMVAKKHEEKEWIVTDLGNQKFRPNRVNHFSDGTQEGRA